MRNFTKCFISFTGRLFWLAAFITIFSTIAIPAYSADQNKVIDFNIPAQSVDTALLAYSDLADMQMIVDADTVRGKQSPGATGRMDIAKALDSILQSTGLSYEFMSSNTVTITTSKTKATPSGGDENSEPDESSSGDNPGNLGRSAELEEILVTAEKKSSNIQDTPISVAAFTSDHLARSGIEDIYDIGLFTPGLIVNSEIVGKIYIRGIGTENLTIGGDPGVPVHVDGAYVGRTSAAIFDLYDVERVEVLRGPQGTLYGRNATGGSVNIISKAPTDELYSSASLQYGNYDRLRVNATISGPISDKVQVRASLLRSRRDGFTPNVFTGEDLDTEDLWAGRLRLRFLPSENVTFDLITDFSYDDGRPAPFKQLEFSDLFEGLLGAFDPPSLREVAQDSPVTGKQDQFGITGILNWDMGAVTLTSITNYRDVEFAVQFDGDAVDLLIQNFEDTTNSEQFTQEFRLASNDAGPLKWILGAYYFKDDGDTEIFIPIPGFGFDILHQATISTKAFALFGQVNYDVTEKFSLTMGLRWSTEDKEAFQFSDFDILFPAPFEQDLDESSNAFTPKFGFEYRPNSDLMLYASITRGFKSGGFTFNGFQSNFDPEFVWAYEGGIKSQLMENKLQFNASFFYYDYSDLQVSKLENNAGVITNAADATIYGSEIELVAVPNERWQFNAGLSLLHAEFNQFLTEDPSNPQLGTIDLAGNSLTRSPKVTFGIGAQHHYPINGLGELTLRVDYQYQGKSFFTAFNRDLSAQQSFGLFNARVTFTHEDGGWQLSGFIKNAFDKEYFLNILESGVETGKPEGFLAAPRTYGMQLEYSF